MYKVPKAILKKEIPASRCIIDNGGRPPEVGDILELDQAFKGSDGKPMVLAYHQLPNGDDNYEVQVYETEIA